MLSATWACVLAAPLMGCGNGGDDVVVIYDAPTINLLSSKAEYVSGGDALVDIALPTLPAGATAPALVVTLNGADVSATFKADTGTHRKAVLGGLAAGANTLVATYGGPSATMKLTNYALTGPMLSGPQLSPFICQTQDFVLPDGSKLGAATDANCSAPTKVQYVYRAAAGGALKPLPDPKVLPADVATITTTAGVSVPFVVRVETGTMNRGIYQNAILFDPTKEGTPTPLTPPKGWNKRLIAVHGTGCAGGWYVQGSALGVSVLTGDNLTRLSEGYAVFNNSLNHPTNSCNATLAGETTMMGKEHFIKTYGVPSYTVSVGTSGGAYTSLQVADAFPGLFDGVYINATFPDAMSIAVSGLDAKLLSNYLLKNNGASLTEAQMVTVSGNKNARAWYDLAIQSGRTDPVPNRVDPIPASPLLGGYKSAIWNAAVPVSLRYDPLSNPKGARPTVFDVAKNIYGVDAATGFARRPYDNVGVQYGLAALNSGAITPAQFIDLNRKVGGYDQDGNYTAARAAGDEGAIKRAYQSGLQLGAGTGLSSIPIFDTSNYYDEDNYYHYQWFHFAVRERLAKSNGGDTRNHVMWRGGLSFTELFGVPGADSLAVSQASNGKSWSAFVRWMDAYKADASSASQRDKVIANKPADAVDGCFTKSTAPQFIAEKQTLGTQNSGQCNAIWPSWTAARIEAGGPVAADILKCQLKPVALADYKVALTDADKKALEAVFPSGVCDWSKPGVSQVATVPYASFGPSAVSLTFDVTKP